ncbi:MAG: site-specific integrase [Odoribacter sp.]
MKSTFTVAFFLKRSAQRKSGEMPVVGRITVNGQAAEFRPQLIIKPENWSVAKEKAIGRSVETIQFNGMLDSIRGTILQHYQALLERDGIVTADGIRKAYFGQDEQAVEKREQKEKSETTLIQFFTKFNEEYKLKIAAGTTTQRTYSRYLLTKERLIEFMMTKYKISDTRLDKIDLFFIEAFYLHIRTKHGCTNNTSMKFIQRFCKVVTLAKDSGLISIDPFAKYEFHFNEVNRGFLTQDELNTIEQKHFPSKRLSQVRDIFIFSCYCGLSYIDICNLREKNIQTSFDNHLWIKTTRQKTDVNSNIRLLDIPKAILEKYAGKQADGKLLPIISNQKMNDYLAEIGNICGINKHITFHLARHTFATVITLSQGVPIETVSRMLGHKSIRTTQIYAKIIDLKISQDMDVLVQKMNDKKKITI